MTDKGEVEMITLDVTHGTFDVYTEAENWILSSDVEEQIRAVLDDDRAAEKILDIVTEAFRAGCRKYWQYYGPGSCPAP